MALPDNPQCSYRDLRTAAALAVNKSRTLSLTECDYKMIVDLHDEDAPITVKRMGLEKGIDTHGNPSIWERGHGLLPQRVEPFSKDSTLVSLICDNAKLGGHSKMHAEVGDGAQCRFQNLFRIGLIIS